MLQKKCFFILTALLATTIAFAALPKPDVCPSTSVLKMIPLLEADEVFGMYLPYSISHFSTNNTWFFAIGLFDVNTGADAIQKANILLPTLYGNPTPINDAGNWECDYQVADDSLTATAFAEGDSITHVIRRLRQ